MPKQTTLLTRLFIAGLLSLGLVGIGAGPAMAQSGEICRPNGALALADGNGDGVVSLGEIDEIIALAGGNADLQGLRDQAAASGITGIRYTGCTPDGGGASSGDTGAGSGSSGGAAAGSESGGTAAGSGSGGTAAGSGSGGSGNVQGDAGQSGASVNTTTSGTGSATTTSGTSGANASGVTGLPGTGVGAINSQSGNIETMPASILLFAAAGSLLAVAAMFSFRFRAKKA